jgi:hypothetical protein
VTSGQPTAQDLGRRVTRLRAKIAPSSLRTNHREADMIILGLILLIIGIIAHISILTTIGVILLVVGAVLYLLGATGRAVGGRKHYY